MKTVSIQILAAGFITLFLACNQADKNEFRVKGASTNPVANSFSSSADAAGNATNRKFIRTADVMFRVKNVVHATTAIEDITAQFGGFVTYTNLSSEINNTTLTPVSADSSLETTYTTVSNALVLRVPNSKLDTALRAIATLTDYLDHRIIKADDVGLQLLSNQMTQSRTVKHEKRLTEAIDKKGKKLDETTDAEESLVNKQEQSDNAKIANLALLDQAEYSTVNLAIYERPAIKRVLLSNNKNIEEYKPGFGTKLLDSLKDGWTALESIIVFLAKLWGLVLLLIIALIVWRKVGYSKRVRM